MSKKRIISIILSLIIICSSTFAQTYIYAEKLPILTFDRLHNKYPKAKFIKVSAREFEEMRNQGELISIEGTKLIVLPTESKKITTPTPTYNETDILSGLNSLNFPSCTDKDCVYTLVFIGMIIGVYVVAVLVADGVYLLGDVILNEKDVKKWFEMGATASYFSYRTANSEIENSSIFGGLTISSGFIDRGIGIGFISEFGHINLDIDQDPTDERRVYGAYGMIGTTFRYGFSRISSFHLDVMAGVSDVEYVDVMGVARVGLNFKIAKHGFFDINYGVNYLGLEDMSEGMDSSYNGTVGVSFGYRY